MKIGSDIFYIIYYIKMSKKLLMHIAYYMNPNERLDNKNGIDKSSIDSEDVTIIYKETIDFLQKNSSLFFKKLFYNLIKI